VGFLHPKSQKDDPVSMAKPKVEVDPTVFNFYIYLRTHPLIARHQLAGGSTSASAAVKLGGFRSKSGAGGFGEEGVTPLERRLYFSTAHFHLRCGCPALAIEVLSKLPTRIIETKSVEHHGPKSASLSQQHSVSSEEDVAKSTPVEEKASASDFDWSQPVAPKNDDELNLEWSDHEDKDDEDDDLNAGEKGDAFGIMGTANTDKSVDHASADKPEPTGVLDIMAQQLKFIACLKIMMEELSTLATGFEVDGGLLRYQLYIWLEREVEALRQLCNYCATDVKLSDEDMVEAEGNFQTTMRELYRAKGRRPTLHEVMMAEKVDFEAKVRSTVRRKQWLKGIIVLLNCLQHYVHSKCHFSQPDAAANADELLRSSRCECQRPGLGAHGAVLAAAGAAAGEVAEAASVAAAVPHHVAAAVGLHRAAQDGGGRPDPPPAVDDARHADDDRGAEALAAARTGQLLGHLPPARPLGGAVVVRPSVALRLRLHQHEEAGRQRGVGSRI
jgi:hypothetical protein